MKEKEVCYGCFPHGTCTKEKGYCHKVYKERYRDIYTKAISDITIELGWLLVKHGNKKAILLMDKNLDDFRDLMLTKYIGIEKTK